MGIRRKALKLKKGKKPKKSRPKKAKEPLKKARKPLRKPKKTKRAPKRTMRKALRKTVKKAVRRAVKRVSRKIKAKKIVKKLKSKKMAKKIVKKAVRKPKEVVKPKKLVEKKPDLELLKRREEEQKRLMQGVIKILSDASVRQNLIEIGGENALAIVRNFYGNCSDEDLAKKLKIKISDVRATLNKLHNEGLVNYIREKDSETGWYSYSWSLNHLRMEKWANSQALNLNPHDEGVDYYFCPSCGTSSITNFESAADLSFRCESCNRMLEFIDEKKMTQLYERR